MTADGALLDPDMSHTSTRRPSRATPSRKATHSSRGYLLGVWARFQGGGGGAGGVAGCGGDRAHGMCGELGSVQHLTSGHAVQHVGDAVRPKHLRPGAVVVATEVEELWEDLARECARRGCASGRGGLVAATEERRGD